MKDFFILIFITVSTISYGQQTESQVCDCSKLIMQGKTGKSAYLDKLPYSGICQIKDENGNITKEKSYFNAQLEGTTKTFDSQGILQEKIEYSFNMKHGEYLLYNEKSQPIIIGEYRNNQKEGVWKYFSSDGTEVVKSIEYKFGKEIKSR